MTLLDRLNIACWDVVGLRSFGSSVLVRSIIRASGSMAELNEQQLQEISSDLRWQALCGTLPQHLLPTAFALVREATRRTHRLEHYPVQLFAGMVIAKGGIAEMETGEGKTLTALAPTFLHAMYGKGCHILTSNDYLAERDAKFAQPVFDLLGLKVGFLQNSMLREKRREAYQCDVTYGTEKEMGFDFLRDRLQSNGGGQRKSVAAASTGTVQRGHHFALVDEADSIMVDQARTPLLIAEKKECPRETTALLEWSHRIAERLQPGADYRHQIEKRSATLTNNGCHRVLLESKPHAVATCDSERVYRQVERALAARLAFAADRDYIVMDGTVQIVDESTGRVLQGRKWQDGLHQAVEIKEQLSTSEMTHENARITVQSYLNRYTHLAGMTGTAVPVRREMKRVFGVTVARIPTHRPCRRMAYPTRVFRTMQDKLVAIADEIGRLHQQQRAVLIGTPSVRASEMLSSTLDERNLEHEILHARHDAQEAAIIARAGNSGSVVVATNMAGRGTDIQITDTVRKQGGLHVIATEMHSSARIDRQLIGRTARQGDPGTHQMFLSFEDELLRMMPDDQRLQLAKRARSNAAGEVSSRYAKVFERARKRLERLHERQRRQLLKREKQVQDTCHELGLDPWLESFDMNQTDS